MAKSKHILIIDDDLDLLKLLQRSLVQKKYTVTTMSRIQEAKQSIQNGSKYDLILTDLYFNDGDGLAFIDEIKSFTPNDLPPVAIMTGNPDQLTEVAGFEYGADDYITKPIDPVTLIARIGAILRRSNQTSRSSKYQTLLFEGWKLDTKIQALYSPKNIKVDLTRGLFHLLYIFLQNTNMILSREFLYEHAYEGTEAFNERSIDIQVSRLRRIFSEDPNLIKTVRSAGYIFSAEVIRQDN